MAAMNLVFFVLTGSGLAALVLWLGMRHLRKTRENVQRLAAQLGLTPDFDPAESGFFSEFGAQGLVDGRATELYTFTKGSGKSRTHWCGLRVRPRAGTALEFDLSPQGMGSKVLGWFGVKEVTVGDRTFDDAFFVRTNEPDLLRAGLVPDLQARLLAGRQAGLRGTFKLEAGVLTYVEKGTFNSDELCARFGHAADIIRPLADLAEVVDGG